MPLTVLTLFALLVAGHFLVDFTLQTDTMASAKNPTTSTPLQKAVPWYWWLFAHASEHGLAVGLAVGLMTHSMARGLACGAIETAAHFLIDWVKCQGRINIKQDQTWHLLCKVLWTLDAFSPFPA